MQGRNGHQDVSSESRSDKLDAHARPPESLKAIFKRFQKMSLERLNACEDILDFGSATAEARRKQLKLEDEFSTDQLHETFSRFLASSGMRNDEDSGSTPNIAYGIADLPGLLVYPALLPPSIQLHLLRQMFHEHLSNPAHKTNVHMHYDVVYPVADPSAAGSEDQERRTHNITSFFDSSASTIFFNPKDPAIHSPFPTGQFLRKKLRWMTLGGQYDWTAKCYPDMTPPSFPSEMKHLIEDLFPRMKAEAAIVNLYSPSDTLSLHRDVSEECAQPLVSISLGCDGLFVVGGEDGKGAVVRLRSGDAVVMEGGVRYAWHGVPRVLEGTCPHWMESWPANQDLVDGKDDFEQWRGWMRSKRVNLNVRQMFDESHD